MKLLSISLPIILFFIGSISADSPIIDKQIRDFIIRNKYANEYPSFEVAANKRWPKQDPEIDMTIRELIESKGYTFEEHEVTTEDGYIILIHRIPGKQNNDQSPDKDRPVVLIQHGLLCDSSFWLLNLPEQNLPFILADQGADVWIGNNRGNRYARRHKTLSPESSEFWDFTFDEMASQDLPAMFSYIKDVTSSSNLHYVGHSEGTVIGFIGFPKLSAELKSSIKRFYALAPITNATYIKSPVRVLASFVDDLDEILGDKDLLADPYGILKFLGRTFCAAEKTNPICESVLMVICGWTPGNLNGSRIPVYIGHTPSGTSVKNLKHFLQLFNAKRFRAYDYGSDSANMARYNQSTPPDYDVSYKTYKEPKVVAFTAGNDWLASPRDTLNLLSNLQQSGTNQQPALANLINLDKFNHLDVVWGITANENIFHRIAEDIYKTV